MAKQPPLRYEPLDDNEIRLVGLDLDDNETISCTIVNDYIDNPRFPYQALSYVWGDPTDVVTISVDGQSLQITRNLHGALRRLRAKGFDWLMWIDAICINQRDDAEKTAQVKLMHTIFSNADIVMIWLGEELPGDAAGFELMWDLREIMLRLEKEEGAANYELDLEALGLPDANDSTWDNVAAILNRPWFHRVWIIQECLVARKSVTLCGEKEVFTPLLLDFASEYCICIVSLLMYRLRYEFSQSSAHIRTSQCFFSVGVLFSIPARPVQHSSQHTAAGDSTLDKIFQFYRPTGQNLWPFGLDG